LEEISLTELLLGYIAGLLTLVNPCVLPVLPIVLVSSLQADRRGPLALAAGLSLSFVVLGLFVIVLGASVGIDQRMMTTAGAWFMVAFGVVLLVPRLNDRFAAATAGFAGKANERLMDQDATGKFSGLSGQFLGGILLGAVWSPCIGPTLGGAISLASQGTDIAWSAAIMTSFALGVSTLVIGLAFGTREVVARRKNALNILAGRAKPILGFTFLCVGVAILSGLDHWLEGQLLDILPLWLQDFSVSV
jgi:cytochrome c-type biogenesis protein